MKIFTAIAKLFSFSTSLGLLENQSNQHIYPNKPDDPCTILAKPKDRSPSLVKACYQSFPCNPALANKTLNVLYDMLSNFYIFLDLANSKPAEGFTYKPVDILSGLNEIRKTKYNSNFEFSNALIQLISNLRDAHVTYTPTCYRSIEFMQPLYLYAPVIEDKQSLRVFDVNNELYRDYVDCEVLEIDGQPGLKTIIDYANTQDVNSKDLGVRLNSVLASYTLSGTSEFYKSQGTFGWRTSVPDKDSITYKISCPNNTLHEFSVQWQVIFPNNWESKCKTDTSIANPEYIPEEFPRQVKAAGSFGLPWNVSGEMIYTDNRTSRFYKLNNNLGVAMISNENNGDDLTTDVACSQTLEGFRKLAKSHVKKIIIDLVNNGGGTIEYAMCITSLLFPSITASFPQDLQASKVAQAIGKDAFNNGRNDNCYSLWDSKSYIEWNRDPNNQTNVAYDIFNPGVRRERGGGVIQLTSKVTMPKSTYILSPNPLPEPLPWGSSDIVVFTDGQCGSSCAYIAAHLKYYNNIKTAAIGGIHNTPLTVISYPGGAVMNITELQKQFKCIHNLTVSIPESLPNADFRVPVLGIYGDVKDKVPLEYVPLKADLHIDYTRENAHDPAIAWRQVAKVLLGV